MDNNSKFDHKGKKTREGLEETLAPSSSSHELKKTQHIGEMNGGSKLIFGAE